MSQIHVQAKEPRLLVSPPRTGRENAVLPEPGAKDMGASRSPDTIDRRKQNNWPTVTRSPGATFFRASTLC